MTAIAELYTVPYFAQDETAGGQGLLDIFTRGATILINNRTQGGQIVPVAGIVGAISPVDAKDLDTTEGAGQTTEGDINVWTKQALQVADEATQQTSMFVRHLGYIYEIDTENNWHYAGGFKYRAFRNRSESGV